MFNKTRGSPSSNAYLLLASSPNHNLAGLASLSESDPPTHNKHIRVGSPNKSISIYLFAVYSKCLSEEWKEYYKFISTLK